jgi:hypothetical protein
LVDKEIKDKFSPRDPENWEKFKSWAADQNFFPEEIKDVSSFQEAEEKIARLKKENEGEKEYFENLYQLLQAVEQLYLNMCLIDDKMSTLTGKT